MAAVSVKGLFKLENTYTGENFCWKSVCGNFYLRERILRIAGKIAKLRTRKNFVPHGRYLKVVCKIWPLREHSNHTITNLSKSD